MSRTSILAIFAGAGLVFSGAVTADTVALARAIQSGDAEMLMRFAKEFPESQYRDEAVQLAASPGCIVNWEGGDCDKRIQGGGSNLKPRVMKPTGGGGYGGGGQGGGEA